jgi:methylase of polypeptide subunit release factors
MTSDSIKINPEHTKHFSSFLKKKSTEGIYRTKINFEDNTILVDVFPTVFPPDHSPSSKSIFETFGDLKGSNVADVGCGTGIQSIIASLAGAVHVDSSDINPQAVECAGHNALLNGLQDKITVFLSNLFSNFPNKKYNLIIANLPFVNFDAGNDFIDQALYDNDFTLHKRFFVEAKTFLSNNGIIYLPHANLQSAHTLEPRHDFEIIEKMIDDYGYQVIERHERSEDGFVWINYKIKLK